MNEIYMWDVREKISLSYILSPHHSRVSRAVQPQTQDVYKSLALSPSIITTIYGITITFYYNFTTLVLSQLVYPAEEVFE